MLSWAQLLHGFSSKFYTQRNKMCLVSVSHDLLQSFQLILQLLCLTLLLPMQRTPNVPFKSDTVDRLSWWCWASWSQWGSTQVEQIGKWMQWSLQKNSLGVFFCFGLVFGLVWFCLVWASLGGFFLFFYFFSAACAIATVNKVLKQTPNFQDVTSNLFTRKVALGVN